MTTPARRHLFVCVESRPHSGRRGCGDRGGREVLAAVQRAALDHPAAALRISGSLCLGPCLDGPNAVLYPEGCWYRDLTEADGADVLRAALTDGHAAKRCPPPGGEDVEDVEDGEDGEDGEDVDDPSAPNIDR